MKKILLIVTSLASCCISVSAKKTDNIPANQQLNTMLVEEMNAIYAKRNAQVNRALKSTSAFEEYRQSIQLKQKELFSQVPNNIKESIPTCQLTKEIKKTDFSISNIILSDRITANLYKPTAQGKHPAVLIFCGHEMEGKATPDYQIMAQLLAKNGFVVLMPDPTSQGERRQMLNSDTTSVVSKATTEHTLLNMAATLVDWSMAEDELIDNIICMNYLCSLSEVDSAKIGCMGNSGGGTQTTYFSAFDDRVKAAACCSWYTKRQRMIALYGPDDGCQYMPNEIGLGMEINDYYLIHAPRPTLILAGTKDFIDYQGTEESFKELKEAYKLLGHEENAQFFAYTDGHGLSKPKRDVAIKFFLKHLANDSTTSNYKAENNNLQPLTTKELRCTKSGNVIIDYASKLPIMTQRMKQMSEYYVIRRKNFMDNSPQLNKTNICRLLGISEKRVSATFEKTHTQTTSKATETTYIVKRKGGVDNHAIVIIPKTTLNNKVVIALSDFGAREDAKQIIDSLCNIGTTIICFNPCGIGETEDDSKLNNTKYYSKDYRNAALMLMLGKTMIGEQTEDILSVVDLAKKLCKTDSIMLISHGNIGIAAQHAYYLDERIKDIHTEGGVETWREMLNHPTEKDKMGLIVPGALLWYDVNYLEREIY